MVGTALLAVLIAVEEPVAPPDEVPPPAAVDAAREVEVKAQSRPSARSRMVQEVLAPPPAATPANAAGFDVGAARHLPPFMSERSGATAAALGGLVGFGSGHLYAGSFRRGVVLAATDFLLVASFAALYGSFTREVVHNDFASGQTLAAGSRAMSRAEERLYAGTWACGVALAVTHVFQAFDAAGAAARTNALLSEISFVPLPAGAGLEVGF